MAKFRYEAISAEGDRTRGEMENTSVEGVIEALQDSGCLPISAHEIHQNSISAFLAANFSDRKISGAALAATTHELGVLLKAGIPLDRALTMLVEFSPNKNVQHIFSVVLDRVRNGDGLGEALSHQRDVFPPLYVSMVRAGEMSGNLNDTLSKLAAYLIRSAQVKETIQSALIYPIILLVMTSVSLLLVFTVVLPQFEPLFRDAGALLPLSTRIILVIGNVIQNYWWAGFVVTLLGLLIARYLLEIPSIALRLHRSILNWPMLGDLIMKIEMARFSRTLGTSIINGVELPAALALSGATLGNRAVAHEIEKITIQLKEGEGLSGPMEEAAIFPRLATHLIRVGEETGRLGEMLSHTAEIYDREVQKTTERFLAILTPTITVGLGLIIAGVVASILVAVLSVNDLVG